MSTFSGLSAALSGLYANRRGTEVTAHNIANASTPGYSRQRAELKAIGGVTVPGLQAQAQPLGHGVMVDSVQRTRDSFLETRARTEHANAELLAGRGQTLSRIEQAFAEPSDTAMQSQLTELWSAFGDLSNQPKEPAARSTVLARASILSDSIRDTADQLSGLWNTAREQLDGVVTEINTAARGVAELNRSVIAANSTGQPANDLADQRDLLVMKLTELTGARATTRADGSVDVQVNGTPLVMGISSRDLEAPLGPAQLIDIDATNRVEIQWVDAAATDAPITPPSGRLAAELESLNTTLKFYYDELDGVTRNLAGAVNTQHALGRDLDGALGGEFFTGGADPISASNIRVSAALLADSDLLAASGGPAPDPLNPNSGVLDGGNADALAQLGKDAAGPDRQYRQMVVDLGVTTQTINRRTAIQANIVAQIDTARDSASGVSLDEEMTNLVAFERGFQAAAKVISTIDEMLDTLINRMGR